MLNICIPVFNYDVNTLVNSLHKQCIEAGTDFNILIFEDGSDKEHIEINSKVKLLPDVKHLISEKNTGRSAARNFLADNALPGKILFMDCDSAIHDKNYIKNYLYNFDKEIVCGGTAYLPAQKKRASVLRYKYGIKREMTTAATRNKNPNKAFSTFNFMISKDIFKTVRFREFLHGYGHEDSLFGFELKTNSYNIHHIDNPVVHEGIEDNNIFLEKTEQGIRNLLIIENNKLINKDFTREIRIVKTYYKLRKLRLISIPYIFFRLFENIVKKHLLKSQNPCLYMFDLYKIGYYCKIKRLENEKTHINN